MRVHPWERPANCRVIANWPQVLRRYSSSFSGPITVEITTWTARRIQVKGFCELRFSQCPSSS